MTRSPTGALAAGALAAGARPVAPGARLRLALPFTVLAEPGVVRLVAGEDLRYTLRAAGIDGWLPPVLARLDGACTVADAVAPRGDPAARAAAADALARLRGERVLVDATALEAHTPGPRRVALEGQGALRDAVAALLARDTPGAVPGVAASAVADGALAAGGGAGPADASVVRVLCDDRLDYAAALAFGARARADGVPALWATTGPRARGFVGPVVLPDAGPCLACLLGHFRRLSPAPDVMDALLAHARAGGAIVPSAFPPACAAALAALVLDKVALLADPARSAAPAFRLHVLEVADLEVSAHRVLRDPECPACGEVA